MFEQKNAIQREHISAYYDIYSREVPEFVPAAIFPILFVDSLTGMVRCAWPLARTGRPV